MSSLNPSEIPFQSSAGSDLSDTASSDTDIKSTDTAETILKKLELKILIGL